MPSRFPIVEETKGLVKKENELCAQIIRNLQTIYDQKIHMAMAYSSLFNFCVEELKMSPSSAQRRCDAVKLSQSVPDLVKKIEDGLVSVSRVAEVSRYIRHEQREAGRVLPPAEVRDLFSKAAEVSNDREARKILMKQTAAPIHSIPDRRQIVAGGRTVLEFEVDDEFLDLFDAVQNLHSHKGKRKMCEFLKDVLKDQLQYKHPAFKREAKKNIRIQSPLPLELGDESTKPKNSKSIRGISGEAKLESKNYKKSVVGKEQTSKFTAEKLDLKKEDFRSVNIVNGVNTQRRLATKNYAKIENLEFDYSISQTLDHARDNQTKKAVSCGSENPEGQIQDLVRNTQSISAVSYGNRKLEARVLGRAPSIQTVNLVLRGNIQRDSQTLDHARYCQTKNAVSYGGRKLNCQSLDDASDTQPIDPVSYGSENSSDQTRAKATGPRRDEKRTRYIPTRITRAIWKRDEARCTHVDPQTRKRCGSKFRVQLDHLRPFSQGGENSVENLVLRCQGHNLFRAGQMGLLSEIG